MVTCYVGIGSNLANRRKNIKLALDKIEDLKDTRLIKVSKIIESEPKGGPSGQGKFLNAAAKIETKISALKLLREFKRIERDLGRLDSRPRWGPRAIDLDILFYGDKIIKNSNLTIPHPRIFEREFVINPLLEVI